MDKMKTLVRQWDLSPREKPVFREVPVQLVLRDVARIRALQALYPGLSEEQILTDIITAALDEIEEAIPYKRGDRVIAEDAEGDPVYEDVGKTQLYKELTSKIIRQLESGSDSPEKDPAPDD